MTRLPSYSGERERARLGGGMIDSLQRVEGSREGSSSAFLPHTPLSPLAVRPVFCSNTHCSLHLLYDSTRASVLPLFAASRAPLSLSRFSG